MFWDAFRTESKPLTGKKEIWIVLCNPTAHNSLTGYPSSTRRRKKRKERVTFLFLFSLKQNSVERRGRTNHPFCVLILNYFNLVSAFIYLFFYLTNNLFRFVKLFNFDAMLMTMHCVNGNNLTDGVLGFGIFEFIGY